MTPEQAVQAALRQLSRQLGPPPAPPAPRDTGAMLDYWDREGARQGTRELAAALGRPYAKKPAGPAPRKGSPDYERADWKAYRDFRSQSRQIQRWRNAEAQTGKEARRIQPGELEKLRQVTRSRWGREHPRRPGPTRGQVLAQLLAMPVVRIDFAGIVKISDDEGWRTFDASVPGPALAGFVAAASAQDWGLAADELSVAWNGPGLGRYSIPVAFVPWLDVDRLDIRRGP